MVISNVCYEEYIKDNAYHNAFAKLVNLVGKSKIKDQQITKAAYFDDIAQQAPHHQVSYKAIRKTDLVMKKKPVQHKHQ